MIGSARGIVMVSMAMFLGGCASGQSGQALRRLQSHVGLLDERVSQLERTGGGWQADGLAAAAPLDVTGSTATIAPAASEPVKTAAGAAASGKASTRDIQQALKNAGFYQGSVDGKLGPMTKEAIREFQRVHGLKDDGVVGRQTWAKLSQYANLTSAGGSSADALK